MVFRVPVQVVREDLLCAGRFFFRSPHPVPGGDKFTTYTLSSDIFRYLTIDLAILEYSVSCSML